MTTNKKKVGGIDDPGFRAIDVLDKPDKQLAKDILERLANHRNPQYTLTYAHVNNRRLKLTNDRAYKLTGGVVATMKIRKFIVGKVTTHIHCNGCIRNCTLSW
jgi:hypothetical protein